MNYYNRIYYTRLGGIVKRFFAWRYAIDFIEDNCWPDWSTIVGFRGFWRIVVRMPLWMPCGDWLGRARCLERLLGDTERTRLGGNTDCFALLKKFCPRSDWIFSNFFSRLFFQDFRIPGFFSRMPLEDFTFLPVCLVHGVHILVVLLHPHRYIRSHT
jgi:hypothetical protein